jgi:hypothetical protein
MGEGKHTHTYRTRRRREMKNDAKWRFPKDKHWCKNDE